MALTGDISSVIGGIVGGRCYPVVNSSPTVEYPYITFQVIGNIPDNLLDGPSGLNFNRIQIDVYSKTYTGSKTVSEAVKTAILSAISADILFGDLVFSMDNYEDGAKAHRTTLEYELWSE